MKAKNCAPSGLGIGGDRGHRGAKVHRANGAMDRGIAVRSASRLAPSVVKADLPAGNARRVATGAKGLASGNVIEVHGPKGGSHHPRWLKSM